MEIEEIVSGSTMGTPTRSVTIVDMVIAVVVLVVTLLAMFALWQLFVVIVAVVSALALGCQLDDMPSYLCMVRTLRL